MSGASADGKSLVLQAVDIVQLIGQSVALKRRGKDYVGLCPFHQEKTPSFHVSPTKQFFHCYGCKAGGNAIDFVIKRDRVEFLDALRTLADWAKIELPQYGRSKEQAGERQLLIDANSAAAMYFEKRLADPVTGAEARAYLQKRGIDDESVKRFRIGIAPNAWDGLLTALGRKHPASLLQQAGLVKARERGSGHYDTFRNRLMFPIRDEAGRVIAFGGRVMPGSEDPAKYLNSPETPLFSKSKCLFGLDLARQRIVETRTVAVVEGYTDVVMAHQFGVSNVVSALGTALTEQHVAILRRFADRIVLLFDADAAGDTAVNRAVELFLTQPVEIAIASMPDGVDPDEYLLAHGAEAFDDVLAKASDALTYKWKQLDVQFRGSDSLTGRQKTVEEYLQTLAAARGSGPVDPLRWGAALARVSRLTEIPVDELQRRFRTRPTSVRANGAALSGSQAQGDAAPEPIVRARRRRENLTARDRAERWILAGLLLEPRRWHDVQQHVSPEDFADELHRKLARVYWDHQRDEGEPVFNELLGLLPQHDPLLVELAIELVDEAEQLQGDEAANGGGGEAGRGRIDLSIAEAIRHLAEARQHRERQNLVANLRRTSDVQLPEQDEVALLQKLQESARRPDLRRVGS